MPPSFIHEEILCHSSNNLLYKTAIGIWIWKFSDVNTLKKEKSMN